MVELFYFCIVFAVFGVLAVPLAIVEHFYI